jgi:hypothetical protein
VQRHTRSRIWRPKFFQHHPSCLFTHTVCKSLHS